MKKKTALFRIDEQVFFTMVAVCVVSLIILGFRYATSETCYSIRIKLPSDTVQAGNRVTFKAETTGGKVFTWDFRDGNTKTEESPLVSHTFKTPGKYTISVTVNESCSEYSTLVVVPSIVVVKRILIPPFVGPETVNVNEPVSFEDTSSGAKSWEWQFEAGGNIEARTKQATYTFITPGRYLVTLTLDGRADMFTSRYIDVLDNTPTDNQQLTQPRDNRSRRREPLPLPQEPSADPITPLPGQTPPEPEPEPVKKAPMILGIELGKMLEEVAKGRKTAQDFSEYFCGQLDKQVTYNVLVGTRLRETKVTTFNKMCEELKGERDRRVREITVVIYRDPVTQCILALQVTLKKSRV